MDIVSVSFYHVNPHITNTAFSSEFALSRHPVAAVGMLQSCDPDVNAAPIICKNVVAFHAKDMATVEEICGLDFNEEPMDQRCAVGCC